MTKEEIESQIEDAVEVAEREVKKSLLSQIEAKCILVKAYKNGPLLADSLVITYDDWLEIKSGRKSRISYSPDYIENLSSKARKKYNSIGNLYGINFEVDDTVKVNEIKIK